MPANPLRNSFLLPNSSASQLIIWRCDGYSFYATSAPGIARIGFAAWWRNQVPDSAIFFHHISHPEDQFDKNVPLHGVTILEKHTFPYGDQSLTCWDLVDRYYALLYPDLDQKRFANIQCSSDREDLYAGLVGWRGYTSTFSDILRQISPAK